MLLLLEVGTVFKLRILLLLSTPQTSTPNKTLKLSATAGRPSWGTCSIHQAIRRFPVSFFVLICADPQMYTSFILCSVLPFASVNRTNVNSDS